MTTDDLTPAQESYAEWLATPESGRLNLRAFAPTIGVSHMTLYRWRKQQNIIDRANEIVDENVGGPDRVRQVVDRIYAQAMEGNSKQQELYLKYAGRLTDRKVVETYTLDDVEELSDEELQTAWDSEAEDILEANGPWSEDDNDV